MDNKVIFDFTWVLIKSDKMNDFLLKNIVNSFLDNTDENEKKIDQIKLFSKNDYKFIGETAVIFQKTNFEITRNLYNKIREYFLINLNLFKMKDVLNIIWAYNKLNLLQKDDIFLKLLNDYFSKNIKHIQNDSESLLFLFNFLNQNIDPQNYELVALKKHIVKLSNQFIFSSDEKNPSKLKFGSIVDVLVYYVRISAIEELHFKFILSNLYQINELVLSSCVNLLWIISYCKELDSEDLKKISYSVIERIKNLENDYESLSVFHSFLMVNSLFYFSQKEAHSNIEYILKHLEKVVILNLKNYNIIEFVSIVNCYFSKNIATEKLLYLCLELIINCIEQFNISQLEILKNSFTKMEFKNKVEILNHFEIITRKLNIQAIQKEVENIDKELIKEVIHSYINQTKQEPDSKLNKNEENKFKKLI